MYYAGFEAIKIVKEQHINSSSEIARTLQGYKPEGFYQIKKLIKNIKQDLLRNQDLQILT